MVKKLDQFVFWFSVLNECNLIRACQQADLDKHDKQTRNNHHGNNIRAAKLLVCEHTEHHFTIHMQI